MKEALLLLCRFGRRDQGLSRRAVITYLFVNYIVCVLSRSCLIFYDDIKIFTRACSSSDQEYLQQSLYNVSSSYLKHGMELNVSQVAPFSVWRLFLTRIIKDPIQIEHIR